jgi:hypothetical protein
LNGTPAEDGIRTAEEGRTLSDIMAEIIHLRTILQARRRQREQEHLHRCVEVIEQSLQYQVEEFSRAPAAEWPVRASKIRKLGELLEYATSLL